MQGISVVFNFLINVGAVDEKFYYSNQTVLLLMDSQSILEVRFLRTCFQHSSRVNSIQCIQNLNAQILSDYFCWIEYFIRIVPEGFFFSSNKSCWKSRWNFPSVPVCILWNVPLESQSIIYYFSIFGILLKM